MAHLAADRRAARPPHPAAAGPDPDAGPIGALAFAGVAVASFGGPLALAALNAPSLVSDAASSAGLAMVLSVLLFMAPLAIWLRYSDHIASAGGLYGFVVAAAGRRVALAQAGIWVVSYVLYLVYTTVQIVYDILPVAIPGVRQYQSLLALLIPVAIVAVMLAGRAAALVVLGLIAGSQIVIAGILDVVTLAHISTPISSFGTSAPAGALAKASAQSSQLYICGSLPLFLGAEITAPARTIRRGLTGAFALTALVVILAVAPLAAAPGLTRTAIPGVAVAQQFASQGFAEAVGIGVAVSTAGIILWEYLALTRLLHAVTAAGTRRVTIVLGAIMLAVAPFTLINPDGFYNTLIKPSLVALWLSQVIVFAVYPRFALRHGERARTAWALGAAATGFAIYGLVTAFQQATS
jgi:hypothetical protein